MANVMRYRKGTLETIQVPIASATVIEVGDLVCWDTSNNVVIPISDTGLWDTDENTTQLAVVKIFLGVAMDASAAGETYDIVVATAGMFEYPAAAGTYNVGTLVIPPQDGSDVWLKDQEVEVAAGLTDAIGRVVQQAGANPSTVLVRINSTYGGYRAAAEL